MKKGCFLAAFFCLGSFGTDMEKMGIVL